MYEDYKDDYYERRRRQREPQTLWDLLMEQVKDDESKDRKKFIEVID